MPIDSVVKLGGALLAHPEHLQVALAAIARSARTQRLVVVPGGGAFADAVREVDSRMGLSGSATHWMAILAMDQHAYLIVDRLERGVLVEDQAAIDAALAEAAIPVLAPFRWLRRADPLPHSWEVTGDSIAAWIAGQLQASRLVLLKPPGSAGDLVDDYFTRALPADVTCIAIPADEIHQRPDFR